MPSVTVKINGDTLRPLTMEVNPGALLMAPAIATQRAAASPHPINPPASAAPERNSRSGKETRYLAVLVTVLRRFRVGMLRIAYTDCALYWRGTI